MVPSETWSWRPTSLFDSPSQTSCMIWRSRTVRAVCKFSRVPRGPDLCPFRSVISQIARGNSLSPDATFRKQRSSNSGAASLGITPYAPRAIAVAVSRRSKDNEKKTTRVHKCSDLIAASNCSPLRSSRDVSSSAKFGDWSRMTSTHVFPSRQLATTLKSLSADKMLFRPHRITGWRSAITTLMQRGATFEDSNLANACRIARCRPT
jgi:hypothetical protein